MSSPLLLTITGKEPNYGEVHAETFSYILNYFLNIFSQDQPNILWIYVDDMSPWMGCYGDEIAQTPNIDQLAKEGVLFKNAHMPSSVCSATRSALITGAIQTTFGLHHHRTRLKEELPDGILTLPEIFKNAGYITFNEVKEDYNFIKNRDLMYSAEPDFKRPSFNKAFKKWETYTLDLEYPWFEQLQGKKFFGQIQLIGGKLSGEIGKSIKKIPNIDSLNITIPPQYPNHPIFKNAIARHYEQISFTDKQVGGIIKALKKYGLYDNTIIIFFTDHGAQLPRAKQFLYEEGTKVPLIFHAPKYNDSLKKHGVRRNDLANGIDISSTSLDLANLPVPQYFEGVSLFNDHYKEQDFIVTARDRCGNAIDRIRAIRTKKFRYIRNYYTDRALIQLNYRSGYATFQTFNKLRKENKLTELQKSFFDSSKRPAEELYDLTQDPNELNNLASNKEYEAVLIRHQDLLNHWVKKTNDQGQYPESDERLKDIMKTKGSRCINPEYKKLKK